MRQDNSFKPHFAEFDGSDLLAGLAGAATQKFQTQHSNERLLRLRPKSVTPQLSYEPGHFMFGCNTELPESLRKHRNTTTLPTSL